ncbi:hypothetical protein [Mangrovimonas futianensis]|uniref:hypothetical protein n=1 Tax=Mangrovimonas futianensis TaxID=2895523 RepID=UPI001E34EA85|nr:hypothetical protein [Mangrovimonas futianensis]MCF1423157.1 hypothetical protein [Mangrovimonas futianensis]
MKKTIPIIFIILIIYLFYKFLAGYDDLNYNKYGIEYNNERKKIDITEIPETFELTEKPIITFFDYFNASGIYSLEYTTKLNLDSGLVKKRIDVDENGIGIIREYSYYKKGNDTIIDIHNYYE